MEMQNCMPIPPPSPLDLSMENAVEEHDDVQEYAQQQYLAEQMRNPLPNDDHINIEDLSLTISVDCTLDSEKLFDIGPPHLEVERAISPALSIDVVFEEVGEEEGFKPLRTSSPMNIDEDQVSLPLAKKEDECSNPNPNAKSCHSFLVQSFKKETKLETSGLDVDSKVTDDPLKLVWCKLCDRYFFDLFSLKIHVKKVHKKDPSSINKWNLCTYDLEIAQTMKM